MSALQQQDNWTWRTEKGKLTLYDRPVGGNVLAGPFKSWAAAKRDPLIRAFAKLYGE